MSASARAVSVRFEEDRVAVDLADGRIIAVPVAWCPHLAAATPVERASWRLAGAGYGIHSIPGTPQFRRHST